jgi:tRNA G37 N-methylase TrmD
MTKNRENDIDLLKLRDFTEGALRLCAVLDDIHTGSGLGMALACIAEVLTTSVEVAKKKLPREQLHSYLGFVSGRLLEKAGVRAKFLLEAVDEDE